MARADVRRSVLGTEGVEDVELPGTDNVSEAVEPGGTVATRPEAGAIAEPAPAMQTLVEWLTDHAGRTDEDNWVAMEASVAKILSGGGTAEEILRQDLPISGKQYANRPFLIHAFTLTESEHEEGPLPFYANLDVTVAGGERRVLNVGGIKVMAKLMMLDQAGEWPVQAMITAKVTKSGRTVLDLVLPQL